MPGKLDGRRILITGAASGMGRGIAELFAAEGATLALVDLNGEGAAETAGRLGAKSYRCDVSSVVDVQRTVGAAVDHLRGLDGVVNAAGVLVNQAFEESDPKSFATMLAVNLTGPYNISHTALPT